MSHEQETVILTSFPFPVQQNNEIPSPIDKVDPSKPNWFLMDTSFDEISSQIRSDKVRVTVKTNVESIG